MQDAIGEDIDEAIEDVSHDHAEPTEAQTRELLKFQRNLGHPAPRELGRALKHAGAKRRLIRWAMKKMRCPVCESRVRPGTRRPGYLPRSMKFNQTVGCVLFEFDEFGYKVIVLNIICWGTGYQQTCRIPDKTSASVATAFATHWHKHYRMPELIITDQGTEFTGKEVTCDVADHACLHHFIDSQSPWQLGPDRESWRQSERRLTQNLSGVRSCQRIRV